jgi:hypothetical protein
MFADLAVNHSAILSHEEAMALGLKRYFTGQPCKRGHIAERYVRSGICSKCARENFRRWYAENREHVQERVRKYQKDHPQKVRPPSCAKTG